MVKEHQSAKILRDPSIVGHPGNTLSFSAHTQSSRVHILSTSCTFTKYSNSLNLFSEAFCNDLWV